MSDNIKPAKVDKWSQLKHNDPVTISRESNKHGIIEYGKVHVLKKERGSNSNDRSKVMIENFDEAPGLEGGLGVNLTFSKGEGGNMTDDKLTNGRYIITKHPTKESAIEFAKKINKINKIKNKDSIIKFINNKKKIIIGEVRQKKGYNFTVNNITYDARDLTEIDILDTEEKYKAAKKAAKDQEKAAKKAEKAAKKAAKKAKKVGKKQLFPRLIKGFGEKIYGKPKLYDKFTARIEENSKKISEKINNYVKKQNLDEEGKKKLKEEHKNYYWIEYYNPIYSYLYKKINNKEPLTDEEKQELNNKIQDPPESIKYLIEPTENFVNDVLKYIEESNEVKTKQNPVEAETAEPVEEAAKKAAKKAYVQEQVNQQKELAEKKKANEYYLVTATFIIPKGKAKTFTKTLLPEALKDEKMKNIKLSNTYYQQERTYNQSRLAHTVIVKFEIYEKEDIAKLPDRLKDKMPILSSVSFDKEVDDYKTVKEENELAEKKKQEEEEEINKLKEFNVVVKIEYEIDDESKDEISQIIPDTNKDNIVMIDVINKDEPKTNSDKRTSGTDLRYLIPRTPLFLSLPWNLMGGGKKIRIIVTFRSKLGREETLKILTNKDHVSSLKNDRGISFVRSIEEAETQAEIDAKAKKLINSIIDDININIIDAVKKIKNAKTLSIDEQNKKLIRIVTFVHYFIKKLNKGKILQYDVKAPYKVPELETGKVDLFQFGARALDEPNTVKKLGEYYKKIIILITDKNTVTWKYIRDNLQEMIKKIEKDYLKKIIEPQEFRDMSLNDFISTNKDYIDFIVCNFIIQRKSDKELFYYNDTSYVVKPRDSFPFSINEDENDENDKNAENDKKDEILGFALSQNETDKFLKIVHLDSKRATYNKTVKGDPKLKKVVNSKINKYASFRKQLDINDKKSQIEMGSDKCYLCVTIYIKKDAQPKYDTKMREGFDKTMDFLHFVQSMEGVVELEKMVGTLKNDNFTIAITNNEDEEDDEQTQAEQTEEQAEHTEEQAEHTEEQAEQPKEQAEQSQAARPKEHAVRSERDESTTTDGDGDEDDNVSDEGDDSEEVEPSEDDKPQGYLGGGVELFQNEEKKKKRKI